MSGTSAACAAARTPEEEEKEKKPAKPRDLRLEGEERLKTATACLEREEEELRRFQNWDHSSWPWLDWVPPEWKRLEKSVERAHRWREDALDSLEMLENLLRLGTKQRTTTRSGGSSSGTRAREQWEQDAWSCYSWKRGWHDEQQHEGKQDAWSCYGWKQGWPDEQQHERKQGAWSCYSWKQGWHDAQQHERKPKGKSRGKGRAAAGKGAPAATRRGHLGHRDRGVERDLDQPAAGGGVALEVQRLQRLDRQVGRSSAQVPTRAEADPHPSAASRGLLNPRTCPSRGA